MYIDLNYKPRLSDMKSLGDFIAEEAGAAEAAGGNGAATSASTFQDRTGYRETFLGDFVVPWPIPGGDHANDVLPIEGTDDNLLDYQHFSIMMSASRKMAMVVGVNIDGRTSVSIKRGNDKWYFDGRIPNDAQLGNDLYASNLLDRGHLVRREDPNWGEQAQVANDDTFHFTNCSPQMAAFNQKTWLSLENYILDNSRRWRDLATVFSGPIFRDDDIEYRKARIPSAFWKVVAFLSDEGKPSATAYIIDQKEELTELEAAFGKFRTYQCSVRSIEQLTGLSFGALAQYDGLSNEEEIKGEVVKHEITGPADIRI